MASRARRFDLAVVGTGPAGMAAAATARMLGLEVVVLDEQPALGGQIYRNVENAADGPAADALGRGYHAGLRLGEALRHAGAAYRPDSTVWQIEPGFTVWCLRAGRVEQVEAERVILASGAMERPVPVPGWTLPGVITVGALQILLKTGAMTPAEPTVLIGNGPLVYLTAIQHVAAGGEIAAVLLTRDRDAPRAALPHAAGFLRNRSAVRQGWDLLRRFRALGLNVVTDVESVALEGEDKLERVAYTTAAGSVGALRASLAGLHEGVVPNVNLAWAVGCDHAWDARQQSFRPRLDDWGNSTVEGIQIVGDAGGIGGADAAAPDGRLAALEVARALGRVSIAERDRRARPERRLQQRALAARPFIEMLYRPRLAAADPADDTIVCRCEEVTAGSIRRAVAEGCQGPNQTKAFLRCGMGPCQGRFCGLTVSRVIAAARGVDVGTVGYFRLRPPVKPVPLGAFAAAPDDVEEVA